MNSSKMNDNVQLFLPGDLVTCLGYGHIIVITTDRLRATILWNGELRNIFQSSSDRLIQRLIK